MGLPNRGLTGVLLNDVPEVAHKAWTRLRDELSRILGDNLVAIWAHGGTIATDAPPHAADLDTHVILSEAPDAATAARIDVVHAAISQDLGVDWDAWYITLDAARRTESPPHAYALDRRDTSWAINRAHWLDGRYVRVHGPHPAEVVVPPTWSEVEIDLQRELEHLERHVVEGDTDATEATYAVLNGSRILHALETGEVGISKSAAGSWALAHLDQRWHQALRAATSIYAGQATPQHETTLARVMGPFVAMVRERLPAHDQRPAGTVPRWSGR